MIVEDLDLNGRERTQIGAYYRFIKSLTFSETWVVPVGRKRTVPPLLKISSVNTRRFPLQRTVHTIGNTKVEHVAAE
jgi:hypothetical protein